MHHANGSIFWRLCVKECLASASFRRAEFVIKEVRLDHWVVNITTARCGKILQSVKAWAAPLEDTHFTSGTLCLWVERAFGLCRTKNGSNGCRSVAETLKARYNHIASSATASKTDNATVGIAIRLLIERRSIRAVIHPAVKLRGRSRDSRGRNIDVVVCDWRRRLRRCVRREHLRATRIETKLHWLLLLLRFKTPHTSVAHSLCRCNKATVGKSLWLLLRGLRGSNNVLENGRLRRRSSCFAHLISADNLREDKILRYSTRRLRKLLLQPVVRQTTEHVLKLDYIHLRSRSLIMRSISKTPPSLKPSAVPSQGDPRAYMPRPPSVDIRLDGCFCVV